MPLDQSILILHIFRINSFLKSSNLHSTNPCSYGFAPPFYVYSLFNIFSLSNYISFKKRLFLICILSPLKGVSHFWSGYLYLSYGVWSNLYLSGLVSSSSLGSSSWEVFLSGLFVFISPFKGWGSSFYED